MTYTLLTIQYTLTSCIHIWNKYNINKCTKCAFCISSFTNSPHIGQCWKDHQQYTHPHSQSPGNQLNLHLENILGCTIILMILGGNTHQENPFRCNCILFSYAVGSIDQEMHYIIQERLGWMKWRYLNIIWIGFVWFMVDISKHCQKC